VILFRQLQGGMRHAMEKALDGTGLTIAQANVLSDLAYGPARSNAALARDSFVTPQTMVEILMSLERRGLVVRRARPEGGRSMPAELTAAGRKALLAIHLAMRKVEERMLQRLPSRDVARFRQMLEECVSVLNEAE
jgi:DNA-binding MarR family transcriptional regulator